MVRKLQVDAPGVDVQRLAEVGHRHGRALQVPTGPARTERAVPARLAIAAALPQHEVASIILVVLVRVDPCSGKNPAGIKARQLAVAVHAGNAEIGRSAGFVRVS